MFSYFFGTKIPMLSAPFIDDICHLLITACLDRSKSYREFNFVGMNDTHNDLCHIAVAASIRLTSALKNHFISFHQPSIPTETN